MAVLLLPALCVALCYSSCSVAIYCTLHALLASLCMLPEWADSAALRYALLLFYGAPMLSMCCIICTLPGNLWQQIRLHGAAGAITRLAHWPTHLLGVATRLRQHPWRSLLLWVSTAALLAGLALLHRHPGELQQLLTPKVLTFNPHYGAFCTAHAPTLYLVCLLLYFPALSLAIHARQGGLTTCRSHAKP